MFKLLELSFINHDFFGTIDIGFTDHQEINSTNCTTLLIGKNGTGKSRILLAVINIFNSFESIYKGRRKKYIFEFEYRIKYLILESEYQVHFTESQLTLFKDGRLVNIDEIELPERILLSAFSFNDKYPLREQRGKVAFDRYYYLGLKSTTNNIFLGNPVKSAISNLHTALNSRRDLTPLINAFTTLDLQPELTLIYKPGKYYKFLDSLKQLNLLHVSIEDFADNFQSIFRSRKRVTPNTELKRLGNDKIERILSNEDNIRNIIEYLELNIDFLSVDSKKEIFLKPLLRFDSRDSFAEFTKHLSTFQLLSDLEVISFQRFEVKKLNTNFSFDDASSGEYHIILTYLNILCLIEDGSLVILDEPEISLHPNWQIRYMDIFNQILLTFPFVIF